MWHFTLNLLYSTWHAIHAPDICNEHRFFEQLCRLSPIRIIRRIRWNSVRSPKWISSYGLFLSYNHTRVNYIIAGYQIAGGDDAGKIIRWQMAD